MKIECEGCKGIFERRQKAITASVEKHGAYYCFSCFWRLPTMRAAQSASIKNSEAHKIGTKKYGETIRGENNPMANGHTLEAKQKMSVSRTGKFGENATAWKGGKGSLNARVKSGIYRRHKWHTKIYEQDNWKCTVCESTKQLDAHHVIPFAKLLTSLTPPEDFSDDQKLNWLIDHPTLKDAQGVALCRKCHKAVHKKWGSHNPEII